LLNDWDREVEKFWQVVPKEMLQRLPQPLSMVKEKRA
jgi:glutamate synthase (NADPH/NADH) large chain